MKNAQDGVAENEAAQDVTAFVGVVAGMSRFLTGLAGAPPFKDGELSLAEWAALSVIAERESIASKLLGRSLGISRQRANQINDSLRRLSFISIEPSASDGRVKVIRVTDKGKSQLATINADLMPKIAGFLATSPGSLPKVQRTLRRLTMHFINSADAAHGRPERSRGSDARAR